MANFQYKAKDLTGQLHQGEIQASDLHAAVIILRKKGLVVINVSAQSESNTRFFDRFFNRVSFSKLVNFTRQLATMISAGLVLSEAVDILGEQEEQKYFQSCLSQISADLKGGLPLNSSLSKFPNIFPNLYVNLVKAGEASGKLDQILLKMADNLEKERKFRAKVRGAMIYPVVVITMMLAVVVIMMVFVIPKLISLYKETSLDLPLPTKILIFTSDIFVNFWWLLILIISIAAILIQRWIKTPKGKLYFDKIMLKMPIIGKIITNVTLTNFNRTMGLLVAAGIPILSAIEIVESLAGNEVYKEALKASYAGVEKGLSFSAQLTSLKIFPTIIGQMVKVGEETGKVDEIFFKLSDYFEQESDQLIRNLTVAIEPIILIVLGIGVAFLVISIILPIYKLTTSF